MVVRTQCTWPPRAFTDYDNIRGIIINEQTGIDGSQEHDSSASSIGKGRQLKFGSAFAGQFTSHNMGGNYIWGARASSRGGRANQTRRMVRCPIK